jgi:hypothetical protein
MPRGYCGGEIGGNIKRLATPGQDLKETQKSRPSREGRLSDSITYQRASGAATAASLVLLPTAAGAEVIATYFGNVALERDGDLGAFVFLLG